MGPCVKGMAGRRDGGLRRKGAVAAGGLDWGRDQQHLGGTKIWQ